MSWLLDSVIFIDHLNGRDEATAFINAQLENIAISVITRAEVLAGVPDEHVGAVSAALDQFTTLDITRPVADRAAALRKRHKWKLPDAFQAALAETHALKLVTRNTKDFDPKRHRFVVVPYE